MPDHNASWKCCPEHEAEAAKRTELNNSVRNKMKLKKKTPKQKAIEALHKDVWAGWRSRHESVQETTFAPTGAAAALPQTILGGRPSDAFKRGRMKLKKITEAKNKTVKGTTNKNGGPWRQDWKKKVQESGNLKLKIKKPSAIHVKIDANTSYDGNKTRGDYGDKPRMPKIKLIKLKESGQALCICDHDFADHDKAKHLCVKCADNQVKFHQYHKNVQSNLMALGVDNFDKPKKTAIINYDDNDLPDHRGFN